MAISECSHAVNPISSNISNAQSHDNSHHLRVEVDMRRPNLVNS